MVVWTQRARAAPVRIPSRDDEGNIETLCGHLRQPDLSSARSATLAVNYLESLTGVGTRGCREGWA